MSSPSAERRPWARLWKRNVTEVAQKTSQGYATELDTPLGPFLLKLKKRDDSFYTAFLNAHGDKDYCRFSIEGGLAGRKGLYCYTVGSDVKYIGRSRNPFRKRVNQGYGVIHPKNCYLDGQSTNCHLNSLIAAEIGEVAFWVCPLERDCDIVELERRLIETRQPEWNTALNNKQPEGEETSTQESPVLVAGVTLVALGLMIVATSLYRRKHSVG